MTALVWDALVGVAVASVGSLFVVGLVGSFFLSPLRTTALTVGRPGTVTFLFEYSNVPGEEFGYSIGPASLLFGGGLGLVYAFVRTWWRQRPAQSLSDSRS